MSYGQAVNGPAYSLPVAAGTFGALASAAVGTVAFANSQLPAYQAMSLGAGTPGGLTCTTAPAAAVQPVKVAVVDGVNVLATAVVTTATAGQTALFTRVPGSPNVAIGDTLTIQAIGTATASLAAGTGTGAFNIYVQFNPPFE